jgi:arsenate reductase-like glutaredoxin family protein
MDWFKYIKIFDGKKPNSIAYGEKVFSKDETLAIINETHHEWKELNNSPSTVYNDLRRKYHLGK